jgi:DNA-binding MarR family transcriptional regulator
MDKRIFFLIVKAEQAITSYFRQQLGMEGLTVTPGQTGILYLLEKGGKMRMSELSSSLEMDNSAATRIVDRLERSGFVRRELNLNDRREFHVMITDQGLKEIKKTKSTVRSMNKKIEAEFSEEELEIFRKNLVRMKEIFRGK